ncbi:MAG: cytochrome c biogenesis protein ResB [Xanthomonadaceae bacterium]|nr:cytochrome c biogenesis protein ResB [Xanthomonadaceae bacterium]
MSSPAASTRAAPSRAHILLEFLGSMNLAITLLMAVAVASVIGTVLKQNEPYQNYIIKFGPFWFEVFEKLALYDVYSAGWFLFILGFLVVSTSVCIYRNAPTMLRSITHFRTHAGLNSLRAFHNRQEWVVPRPEAEVTPQLAAMARTHGYRLRSQDHGDHRIHAAMKGSWNRLGYVFTHAAIVIICIGGLVDGNVPLKLKESSGQIQVETRDIPASQVPAESWLSVKNPSFRGSVTIAEGTSANLAFLQLRDGYLVQPLPFRIELKDFRIEHYFTGQPKSFESDLVIHDPELEEPFESTIAVNHPLIYKGYAIYQASFNDGGSKLNIRAWPLLARELQPHDIESAVFQDVKVTSPRGPLTMELTDFKLYNVNPVEDDDASGKQFRNYGPSFTYKLRDETGAAREYENYMSPVEFEGRSMFISGVRTTPAEPFRYLHIPADGKYSLERFLKFNALLRDQERVRQLAEETTRGSFDQLTLERPELRQEVIENMVHLVGLFTQGGVDAILEQVNRSAPEERRTQVMDAYLKVLQTILGELYLELLAGEGIDFSPGMSETDARFFDDSLNAISSLGHYGAPFFAQLTGFEHLQASGLQIARAPGKNVVYLGCALLTLGVFLMFYVRHSRLWFRVEEKDGHTRLLFAGTGHRHERDFAEEFTRLRSELEQRLGIVDRPAPRP